MVVYCLNKVAKSRRDSERGKKMRDNRKCYSKPGGRVEGEIEYRGSLVTAYKLDIPFASVLKSLLLWHSFAWTFSGE